MLCCIDKQDAKDLTAYERAARVTVEFMTTGRVTNRRARELTGMSRQGVLKLFYALSRRVMPLVYDEEMGTWYIEE